MATIYLLSAEKRSGKTTALFRFCINRNAAGVLMPVINDNRFFYCIDERRLLPADAQEDEQDTLRIGRYNFSENAFRQMREYLTGLPTAQYLIVDEYGPLELDGKGYEPALSTLLAALPEDAKVIITVRLSLTQTVTQLFTRAGHTVSLAGLDPDNEGEISGIP